ncbi:MAG: DUF4388 domain-containing protein [Deltaproteobacteria bacterium]|nr:DUF4388 domain-containing protein [Deltaproteobacteria bacterium]
MPEDLRIDPAGVTPRSESARAILRRAQGKWRLSHAAPDLLLLSRERAGGLAQELDKLSPGPIAVSGDLAQVQPSELLNFLHQGRRDGVLLVRSGEVERGIVLLEGNVAWACSTSPGERLGELICRIGLVPRAALDKALAQQAQEHSHRRLGQMLGERGLLEPDGLWRALRYQIVEIFLGLLVLRGGTFLFMSGVDRDKLPAQLAIDTEALLLDGLRRLDEMEHYRLRIPSSLFVLDKTARPAPLAPEDEFTEAMLRLLERVDGEQPLCVLAEASALGEFEATKAAFKLLQDGYVQLLGEASMEGRMESLAEARTATPPQGTPR